MEGKKLSIADIVLAAGGGLLVVGALLPWFGPPDRHEFFASDWTLNGLTRFSYFGWLTALIGLLILEVVQVRLLAPGRFKLPIPDGIVMMALGGVTLIVAALEMIIQPPGENEFVTLQWGLFLTLAASIVVLAGGFLKLADHPASAPAAYAAGSYGAPAYGQPAAGGYGPPPGQQGPTYAAPAAAPAAAAYAATPAAAPASAAPTPVEPPAPSAQVSEMAPAAEAPPAAAAPFCGSCGASLAADAAFCTSCGAKRA